MNKNLTSTTTLYAFAAIACLALAAGCATTGGGGNPAVGTWNITVESALGTSESVLVINDDQTGNVTVADLGGTLDIQNVALDGQNLSFNVTFDAQGQELPAKFEGTVDGDTISGEFITDLGNGTVTGTRGG